MSSKKAKFWFLLMTANLVPAVALGELIKESTISQADLKEVFEDFHVARPAYNKIQLQGLVFDACKANFRIESTSPGSSLRNSVQDSGFRVIDLGGGRQCQKEEKQKHRCNVDVACVEIASQYPSSRLELKGDEKDGNIKVFHTDPTKTSDHQNTADDLLMDGKSIEFVSDATQRQRKAAQDKAERDERIDHLREVVKSCRRSTSDLPIAESAIRELEQLRAYTSAAEAASARRDLGTARKTLVKKELDKQMADFMIRANKDKVEDLESLREDLKSFASDHSELHDKLAPIFYKVARRYVDQKKAQPEDWDLASETIAEAQDLNVDEKISARLESYQQDIEIGRVQNMAQRGLTNNYNFWPAYMEVAQNSQTRVQESCTGYGTNPEECGRAMQTLRAVSSLPMQAQTAEQQRMMTQMQLQQQMMSMTGGMMPGSMGGITGFYGSPNGGSGFYR